MRTEKTIKYETFTATMDYKTEELTLYSDGNTIIFSKTKGLLDLVDCLTSFGREPHYPKPTGPRR